MDLETKQNKRLIICLTGMPGAGKSTVANSLKEKGFLVITMGDIVREEARQRNLEMTDDNLGNLMLKLRNDLGPGAIAHLILKNVEKEIVGGDIGNIVIDGIRSIAEVEVLKTIGHVKLLAIHAATTTRFGHLKERARSDAPMIRDNFIIREKRELAVGISEAIALADETLSNNNLTIEELKEKAFEIIQKWIIEINSNSNNSSIRKSQGRN
jgi:dephospho-CoA kinase